MAMKVKDLMSRDVKIVSPDDTLDKAAKIMAEADTGVLPVAENDRLVGMLTDRDITIRAVARNKIPAQTRVRDVMTDDVKYVFDDESAEDVARNMSELQVRRLPVLNRDKRLVGIVSLGDLARKRASAPEKKALEGVSQPSH
jgi:CBS-domain-containing membrane protein